MWSAFLCLDICMRRGVEELKIGGATLRVIKDFDEKFMPCAQSVRHCVWHRVDALKWTFEGKGKAETKR